MLRARGSFYSMLLLVSFFNVSCGWWDDIFGPDGAIEQARDAINESVTAIERESSAWRNELPELTGSLAGIAESAEARATADLTQLLIETSNQTRSLTEDTIKIATISGEEWTAKFGTELRCNSDFIGTRVAATLKELEQRLAFWDENGELPPPAPHSVCQVTPDTVELHPTGTGDSWSMAIPADRIVGIYGYDFRPEALPVVHLGTANGVLQREAEVVAAYVTRYQLNLDFSSERFSGVAPGSRFVLVWPDKPEPNTISTSLVQPPRLEILDVRVVPESPRARADVVSVNVTVSNQGGSLANQSLQWVPAPGLPVQSVVLGELQPGQQTSKELPGFSFPVDGTFPSEVRVANGDDVFRWNITVAPYASVPSEQSIPTFYRWPDPGGEPGESRTQTYRIKLGPDCVLDRTRGTDGFSVEDVLRPGSNYEVRWPNGFRFDFHGDVIWTSLQGVEVEYDAASNTAIGRITVRGLGGHGFFGVRGPERYQGTFTAFSKCPPQ